MKLELQDRRALSKTMLGLGFALMCAILAAIVFQQRMLNTEQVLQQQLDQLAQARRHYQTAVQERQLVARYLPGYQQLAASGLVGQEHRRQWLEALRHIQRQHGLATIDYRLAPQQAYQPSFWQDHGAWRLYRSVMQLQLVMLHEGDVLTLLDALFADFGAVFMLRECTLERRLDSPTAAFGAHCELDWLTLDEPAKGAY